MVFLLMTLFVFSRPSPIAQVGSTAEQESIPMPQVVSPTMQYLADNHFETVVTANASDTPSYEVRSFRNHAEASIEVHNLSTYPISVRATGRLLWSNESLYNPNHPYTIKWQGGAWETMTIPSQDSGVLNVVAFGIPAFTGIPLLNNYGTSTCLNFNGAGLVSPTRNYFSEACRSIQLWNWSGLGSKAQIGMEVAIHATSMIDQSKSTSWTQNYLITPGKTLGDIGFSPVILVESSKER